MFPGDLLNSMPTDSRTRSLVTDAQEKLIGYKVIIVGARPVVLALANQLGRHGIRTPILEKECFSPPAPLAVSLDDESLRIW